MSFFFFIITFFCISSYTVLDSLTVYSPAPQCVVASFSSPSIKNFSSNFGSPRLHITFSPYIRCTKCGYISGKYKISSTVQSCTALPFHCTFSALGEERSSAAFTACNISLTPSTDAEGVWHPLSASTGISWIVQKEEEEETACSLLPTSETLQH